MLLRTVLIWKGVPKFTAPRVHLWGLRSLPLQAEYESFHDADFCSDGRHIFLAKREQPIVDV